MSLSPLAGKPAPRDLLVNIARLVTLVLCEQARRLRSGPAGRLRHLRPPGLALRRRASTSIISWPSPRPFANTRKSKGIDGPLFMGMDTHALSEPALASALEVFAAERRDGDDSGGPRLHAHAGHLPRHSDLQPGQNERARRRGGHHPLPQPAR